MSTSPSHKFTLSALLLLCCGSALAAPPTKPSAPTTAQEEPDFVIGSSSKAMAVGAKGRAKAVEAGASARWSVETKDVNLANTFQRWATQAGWKVRWDAGKHVMVEAPDTFTGTFEEAVAAQLASPGIALSAYPLEVCFYPNVPPLARVTRKGEQLQECQ